MTPKVGEMTAFDPAIVLEIMSPELSVVMGFSGASKVPLRAMYCTSQRDRSRNFDTGNLKGYSRSSYERLQRCDLVLGGEEVALIVRGGKRRSGGRRILSTVPLGEEALEVNLSRSGKGYTRGYAGRGGVLFAQLVQC